MIEENVARLLKSLPPKNPYGERVRLVAATKTRSADEINRAIAAGISYVGENKAQEFRDKYPFVKGAEYHFFGRLQSNKLKYLVGKCKLVHSVESLDIARDISALSQKLGVTSDVLVEVNLGERQKGGVLFSQAKELCERINELRNVRIKGLMTMLPLADFDIVTEKCLQMRRLYDIIKSDIDGFDVLSMGTSRDYLTAIRAGSNTVRLGEAIFGKRSTKT